MARKASPLAAGSIYRLRLRKRNDNTDYSQATETAWHIGAR